MLRRREKDYCKQHKLHFQPVINLEQGRAHDYRGAGAQSQKRAVRAHAQIVFRPL